jgi:hypothetical protein
VRRSIMKSIPSVIRTYPEKDSRTVKRPEILSVF